MTSHIVTAAIAVAAAFAVIGVAGLVLVVLQLNKEVW
jgi:hypothetical protein